MKPEGRQTVAKYRLFKGLGRSLTIGFLLLALIPMVIDGVITYQKAYDNLRETVETALKTSIILKTREIRAYFQEMLTDLRYQAETESATRFLKSLEAAHRASGLSADRFVKSYQWARIVDERQWDLKNFRKAHGYYDIFLIDPRGEILFTVAREKDLGANLFSAPYDKTKFSAAVRDSLATGRSAFSDYEKWTPSNDEVFGFITDVIVDRQGHIIGVLAFQFPIQPINEIMQAATGLGRTAETYLVGLDLSLRSKLVLDPDRPLIAEPIRTDQTRLLRHVEDGHETVEDRVHEASLYAGPHGKTVLGIHHEFEIRDVWYGVIAEIEKQEAFSKATTLKRDMIITAVLTAIIILLFSMILARRIVDPVLTLASGANRVERGDFSQKIEIAAKNEIGDLAHAFNAMMDGLHSAKTEAERREWFRSGRMELAAGTSGISDLSELSRLIIAFLAKYLGADVGAIYITEKEGRLALAGTFAFPEPAGCKREFDFGQGLVGQAARDRETRRLTDFPEDYLPVRSGLGETPPAAIILNPLVRNDAVVGVIELGAVKPFCENALPFLETVSEQIAVTFQTLLAHRQVKDLLAKTQAQEKVLRKTNADLEVQTRALKESEEKLQHQQEELEQSNTDLEEQSQRLEEQKNHIEQKNRELVQARRQIEEKANALEVASRYKSEFLANMSHELRTPLNSILLLSRLLADNRDGTLTDDHVASATTIHASGKELLSLINDVLDLSKVEAGKMALHLAPMRFTAFGEGLLRAFRLQAEEKGLYLDVRIGQDLPPEMHTDRQRVEQVLRNLISNAIKFTHGGGITLEIRRPSPAEAEKRGLVADQTVGFYVRDTGIGIPEERQAVIFEAFQQAEGSTNRQYGGTGLGLSISRQLAALLGGQIHMTSVVGKGSTFVLYLPQRLASDTTPHAPETPSGDGKNASAAPVSPTKTPQPSTQELRDDRITLQPEERSILIIEDDPAFLKVLRDLSREQGFQCLVAASGEEGLQLAEYHKPNAIILDIGLPGIDGWAVMARLKENSATRHIPVHMISATDRPIEAMKMGAVDFLVKPVSPEDLMRAFAKLKYVISKPVKDLLVVEDDVVTGQTIAKTIGHKDVHITFAATATEALQALLAKPFDCMILDLNLSDMPGTRLLEKIRSSDTIGHIPIIVYTGTALTAEEKALIDQHSESTVLKGVNSHQKLLDETTLFLHRVEADLPEAQRKILRMLHDKEHIFSGRKILVVDDDMRNVYSLKKILEEKNMKLVVGKNGAEGLARLQENPDTALVLMDIMMPVMDGYEAMRRIRRQPPFADLPIIALTAKAMKGDRAKCIQAGASDYLAKPVDVDRLFSMMRVWLYGRN